MKRMTAVLLVLAFAAGCMEFGADDETVVPKLVGSEAQMPGRLAAARRECEELLAHEVTAT